MSWHEIGTPPALAKMWRENFGNIVPPPTVYENGELEALVGREPVGPNQQAMEDLRWHISVRHRKLVPTWDEMVEATHGLRPGVVFCVPMPPRTWWINVHPNVLHVWEIRDTNLERQWRSETAS